MARQPQSTCLSRFLSGLALVAASFGTTSPVAAEPSPYPNTHSVASFGGDVELRPGAATSKDVRFDLPAGARQGPSTWYRLKLHLSATLRPATPTTPSYISVKTDGKTCALIEVKPTSDHQSSIETSTLLTGTQAMVVNNGASFDYLLTNYLQVAGVQPGANDLSISISSQPSDEGGLALVDVKGDTAVEATDDSPFDLQVRFSARRVGGKIGKVVTVPFKLTNRSGYELRDVSLTPQYDAGAVQLLGPQTMTRASIRSTYAGKIRLRVRRSGSTYVRLLLRADNRTDRIAPVGMIDTTIAVTGHSAQARYFFLGIPLMLLVIGAALLSPYGRRRR